MNVREWINNNSSVTTLAAVLLTLVAFGILWMTMRGGAPGVRDVYYFDLDEGVAFVASAHQLPPIQTPAGGSNGVRAGIYACAGCPADLRGMSITEIEEAGAFVAYFERYTDEARALLERARQRDPGDPVEEELDQRIHDAELMGHVVQRPGQSDWVVRESEIGMRLIDEWPARQCGDAVFPEFCLP